MKVTVVCYGAFRDLLPVGTPGRSVPIEVEERATVADVAAAIGAPSGLVFAVLIDGEQASLGHPVPEGAEVTLMPPFAGGSR